MLFYHILNKPVSCLFCASVLQKRIKVFMHSSAIAVYEHTDMHRFLFPCGQIHTSLVKQAVHFKSQLKVRLGRLWIVDKASTSCQTNQNIK